MQELWNNIWKQLEAATSELNNTFENGLPAVAQNKLSRFVREWDKLKENAMSFDEFMQCPIEPIEVKLPFDGEDFVNAWQYWKEYRLETFGRVYKSREEQKVLDYLDEISEHSPDEAIKIMNFAMAGSYQKFFKVTEKDYKKPKSKQNDNDSDFG